MAIPTEVQKATSTTFTSQTSHTTAALSPAPVQGNLVWSVVFIGDNAASRVVTPPSGWTVFAAALNHSSGGWTMVAGWKLAGASEPTTYTWTWSGGNSFAQRSVIQEVTNVDQSTPIDVSDIWRELGNFSGTGPFNVPSITTLTDNALDTVIINDQAQGPGYACSTSGYSEIADLSAIGVYQNVITPAGATGARAVTVPGGFSANSLSFAIRASSVPEAVKDIRVSDGHRPAPFKPGAAWPITVRRGGGGF